MGAPYSATTVNNYNSNPPSDDGAQVSTNRVSWATEKSKLADPIKTAFDTSESATVAAFGKVVGGGGITGVASDYTVGASDQGKLVKVTVAGVNITTPDALTVGSPFVFAVVNDSAGDITIIGNTPSGGTQQTIDGVDTMTIPAGAGVFINTDGTVWFTFGQNFTKTVIEPQGRLTLQSGTPVMASDVSSGSVYYTPYKGDQIPIPDGSKFNLKEFSELTLTMNASNYPGNTLFDVFVALDPADNKTIIIGSGPAWANSTAGSCTRGSGVGTTELGVLKGFHVNQNAITLRNNTTTYAVLAKCAIYVGTIAMDGSAGAITQQITYGSGRKCGVWNAFRRETILLKTGESTSSWHYTTGAAAWRPSNGNGSNLIYTLCGLPEEWIEAEFIQQMSFSTGSANDANKYLGAVSIGQNSTTAPSGASFTADSGAVAQITATGISLTINWAAAPRSVLRIAPAIGLNQLFPLEFGNNGVTTYSGGESGSVLTAKWRG